MVQRLSTLFVRTLRDNPVDAEVPSHRLLVRAGYIRRAAPGGYTWLPLGLRVFHNVARVIREEMDAIGAQEVNFPAMLPREPYEVTGRWTDYGDNLFRLQDRRKADFLLGPTHEEMFTLLVKDLYSSYKDLPVWLYQIQNKFRDEARPRGGLLRGREFSMKDSYSFDTDQEGLQRSYDAHRNAYIRIFERLGLPFAIVSAMSGAMGGSASEEFLFPCDIGEDTFVQCSACGYSANTEAVRVGVAEPVDAASTAAAQVVDTPDTPTIATLVDLFNARNDLQRADRVWTAADTLKNVVVNLRHPDGRLEPLAIGVPGDREVDVKRLEAQVSPAEVEPFDETHFAANTALAKGYIGPGVLGVTNASGIRFLLDPRIAAGSAWITGADTPGKHVMNLVNGRDFTADGTIDVAEIRDDDTCPTCRSALTIKRGIEIGHVFQLGPKYAEALGLNVLDKNGKQQTVTMGSYGIGVSRAVAAIAEATHDESGLRWPTEVAPFDAHIVIAGKDDAAITAAAENLALELEAAGLKALIDDRQGVSPGVKFKDAELIGVPYVVVAGRGVANGVLEVRDRFAGTAHELPIAQVGPHLVEQVRGK
ncbi:MAG: proline--tRNA ligase [Actinobacteria bacterium]|nr:MAG: proline--tRNA ligase [Acidimicrobium sp. BACL17 MAG-120924-bin0]KRO44232.1 MAG: proline--tRNA ligase [Acidimicrobium sp. BACL17 MAG-120823-bin42]MDA0191793.1 proline--tRNA ligase [Actinomycetota bacterium]MDA2952168.1 proline--tRNA ligase [Actinomycetota bacterium]MDA2998670.1 proline--tRNA ligase [Actinomycetota bacterium]